MRSFTVKNQQSDQERSQDMVAFALNLNFFCKVLEFNIASLDASSASTFAALVLDRLYERSNKVMNWHQTATSKASGIFCFYYTQAWLSHYILN